MRKVDRQELRGLHDAVELVDVFRTLTHVVNARVIQIRLDHMPQAIEAKPAALHLLEGAGHFCGNGEPVVRDGTKDATLIFQCGRGIIERVAVVGFFQGRDFTRDGINRGISGGWAGERSALAVVGASDTNLRGDSEPAKQIRGE